MRAPLPGCATLWAWQACLRLNTTPPTLYTPRAAAGPLCVVPCLSRNIDSMSPKTTRPSPMRVAVACPARLALAILCLLAIRACRTPAAAPPPAPNPAHALPQRQNPIFPRGPRASAGWSNMKLGPAVYVTPLLWLALSMSAGGPLGFGVHLP